MAQECRIFGETALARRARFSGGEFAHEQFALRCPLLPVERNLHWRPFPGLIDIPFHNEADTFAIVNRDWRQASHGFRPWRRFCPHPSPSHISDLPAPFRFLNELDLPVSATRWPYSILYRTSCGRGALDAAAVSTNGPERYLFYKRECQEKTPPHRAKACKLLGIQPRSAAICGVASVALVFPELSPRSRCRRSSNWLRFRSRLT